MTAPSRMTNNASTVKKEKKITKKQNKKEFRKSFSENTAAAFVETANNFVIYCMQSSRAHCTVVYFFNLHFAPAKFGRAACIFSILSVVFVISSSNLLSSSFVIFCSFSCVSSSSIFVCCAMLIFFK